jgi:outer membrane protein OmpA-like peptidoglycan-associated protein
MKKVLIPFIFIILAAASIANAQESKKILNIRKAYAFLDEAMLISETDLNCSYFIKDDVPQDIHIISKHVPNAERNEFSDFDELVIDKGSRDGLKEGDLLMIMSKGPVIHHPRSHRRLGSHFLKKALAQISCIYEKQAIIRLQKSCNPVNAGDFVVLFKPESTVFEKKLDYKLCRIPANGVSGMIVYSELVVGFRSEISSESQYVTVDLGKGVVNKGTFLLVYRVVASDLPPLIIGLGIVIHGENTNSTVKILDASTDIQVNDQVMVLPKPTPGPAAGERDQENIPVMESLPEGQEADQAAAGEGAGLEGDVLNVDVLFGFDRKEPIDDHAADFAAIRDFIAGKSEYLVTLRGYTCSIGGEEYNLRLSSQRVETIKSILVGQYGVDAAHIETFFYGEKEPQFDNSSEVERRKNRLVKIEVNGR